VAIELLVENAEAASKRLVPIVSRDLFEAHWRPAAARLGLAWIPMMATGFSIVAEELPDIGEELRQLHAELVRSASAGVDREDHETAADGVLRLLTELDDLERERDWSAYVG
jgi:hypothetical protein